MTAARTRIGRPRPPPEAGSRKLTKGHPMNVFLTGGSGYLGQATIAALSRRGHTVAALARNERAALRVSGAGATPVAGGLDDPDALRFAAGRSDAVIHLAQA